MAQTKPRELARRTLADNVADAVIGLILEEKLDKGDRLPSVTAMAERFEVSRAIVREALDQLADDGTIDRNGNRRWTLSKKPRKPATNGGSTMAHKSLADQASDAVLRLILDRQLKEGDSLPPSGELAEQLGVSLIVMREALASLAARGILSRRQGRESVVALPSHDLIGSILRVRAALSEIETDEFQRARAILEVEAAEMAARNKDAAADAEELFEHLEAMKQADDVTTFNEHDLAFHLTVAKLSGNRAIELLLASLNDIVRVSLDVVYQRVEQREGLEGIRTAIGHHERVAQAIVGQDPDAAAAAMGDHFTFAGPSAREIHSRD